MSFWTDFVNRFNNEYPYTDYQKINLDWLLDGMKACIEAVENFVVDTVLSTTSNHAIANSTVTQALAGKYAKPLAGIPASDLSESVQTSLDRADSALQAVPDTYRTAAEQDVIDNGKQDTLLTRADVGDLVQVASVNAAGKPTGWQALKDRYIRYTLQLLTDQQKQQARNNIAAQEILVSSGAKVGQLLAVTGVDSNGRPLSWSTVDGFGVEYYTEINEETTPDFSIDGNGVLLFPSPANTIRITVSCEPGTTSVYPFRFFVYIKNGDEYTLYQYTEASSMSSETDISVVTHVLYKIGDLVTLIRTTTATNTNTAIPINSSRPAAVRVFPVEGDIVGFGYQINRLSPREKVTIYSNSDTSAIHYTTGQNNTRKLAAPTIKIVMTEEETKK